VRTSRVVSQSWSMQHLTRIGRVRKNCARPPNPACIRTGDEPQEGAALQRWLRPPVSFVYSPCFTHRPPARIFAFHWPLPFLRLTHYPTVQMDRLQARQVQSFSWNFTTPPVRASPFPAATRVLIEYGVFRSIMSFLCALLWSL
jgi:hypothetical protein